MSQLDTICKFNYNTGQGKSTSHSFPITRSKANIQKIEIASLLMPSTDRQGPAAKAIILRDPSAVLSRKRSTALPPLDVSQPAPDKRRLCRPSKKRVIEPIVALPEIST